MVGIDDFLFSGLLLFIFMTGVFAKAKIDENDENASNREILFSLLCGVGVIGMLACAAGLYFFYITKQIA